MNESLHRFVPTDGGPGSSNMGCTGEIISSFSNINVGVATEAMVHIIITFVPSFKSHPRSELDGAGGGVTSNVNVEDTKEAER